MPRKRKVPRKRKPARASASSEPRQLFLSRFLKARDTSAFECRDDDLPYRRSVGEIQVCISVHVDRWARTLPGLLAAYAQERYYARALGRELDEVCSVIKPEARNWLGLVCGGGLPEPGWLAPAYLAGWPAKLDSARHHTPVAMVHGRLSVGQTTQIVASDYHLTALQAAIVWRLHLRGTPELGQAHILTALASDTRDSGERLRDYFKRSNSDLWGKDALIVRGTTKGTHRLNLPPLPRRRTKPI
jgi:hypothetical protein